MIEISRVLCPTDLSDVAPRAFDQALALARVHQAEVELAYVNEPLLPGPGAPTSYPPWAVLDPAVRGRLQSALATNVSCCQCSRSATMPAVRVMSSTSRPPS